MLLSVNHTAAKLLIDAQFIEIERGEFLTSEVKLAERWGWARKTVRRFLSNLEMEQMLIKKSTSRYTTLKVLNYGLYNDFEEVQETGLDTGALPVSTQVGSRSVHTNNKDTNNDKKVNKIHSIIPFGEIMECWNSNRGSMPAIREVDAKRQREVKAHWKKHSSIEWFQDLFKTAVASDFLCGRIQEKPFVANFDFVLKNAVKILEGTYANRSAKPGYRPSEQDWTNNEL